MKKFLLLITFSSFISAQVDWSDANECSLPDNSKFIQAILNDMSLEQKVGQIIMPEINSCLLYTSPSPRDGLLSRMPSSA